MKRRWFVVAVMGLLPVLPVLYVLSEAPLVRLTGQVPHGGFWRAYEPLDWLRGSPIIGLRVQAWEVKWGVDDLCRKAGKLRYQEFIRKQFPSP